MPAAANTKPGSNSSKKLAPFNAQLKDIQALAKKAERALQGHHLRVHQALVKVFGMGLTLIEEETLDLFVASHRDKISARQALNPFHDLVTLAFVEAKEDSRSKYRKVLKFAMDENWTSTDLEEELRKSSLAELYDRALDADRAAGDQRREDTLAERIKEAKTALATTSLGKVSGLSTDDFSPHAVDGYASAILRVNGNAADIVGFEPAGPKDQFERRLVDLVPTIPMRDQQKLSKKKLYEFFVICDVFTRCLLKRPGITELLDAHHAMQEELKVDAGASPKEFVKALKDRIEERENKPKVTLADVTGHEHVLWLTKQDGDAPTLIDTGTTLPSIIHMKAELQWDAFKQVAPELRLGNLDVENFASAFSRQIDWFDEHTSLASLLSGSDDPPTRFGFPANPNGRTGFRVLKSGGEPHAQFRITKGVIAKLVKWREEFAAERPPRSNRQFARLFRLVLDKDDLWLVFANSSTDRRLLAKHPQPVSSPLDMGSNWLVESRLFERLVKLAIDYGLEYDAQLLAVSGAPFALEVSTTLPTGPCTLTLPMSVGLSGGLVEITDSHVGPAATTGPSSNPSGN